MEPARFSAKKRLASTLGKPGLGQAVEAYFDPARPFAGVTFDTLGHNSATSFTSDDLLAVTLLDVRWTPTAVRDILANRRDEFAELLSAVPSAVDIWSDDAPAALVTVDPLWKALCQLAGVGDTKASKLLARKRPRLVPIADSVIAAAVGTPGRTWQTIQRCMSDTEFRCLIESLRPHRYPSVTDLRVFDVALWMLYSRSQAARGVRAEFGITI